MHGLARTISRFVFGLIVFAATATAGNAPVAGDVDDSGVVDAVDVQFIINVALGISSSTRTDIDFDEARTTDAVDVQLGINAALGISIDADEDGLSDPAETNLGTSSSNTDSDGDGLGDGEEVLVGRDPAVADNPIEINDIDELQLIGNNVDYPLNGSYFLSADIDASSTATWNAGLGFNPIGTIDDPFVGHFDGAGFAIIDLFINRPSQNDVGLFGRVGIFDSAIVSPLIENLELLGGTLTGGANVGALCGNIANGEVSGCDSSVLVAGTTIVGGMFGFTSAIVSDCRTSGNVSATGEGCGGFAGSIGNDISDCDASGNVTGTQTVGGFGGASGALVLRCNAIGDVTGTSAYVGGLLGMNGGTARECTCNGTVIGGFEVGGMIGRNHSGGLVERCQTGSSVTCNQFGGGGGLIGHDMQSTVIECYADGAVAVTSGFFGSGGLIGVADSSTVRDSIARGNVSGADRVAGLIGDASGGQVACTITNCYSTGTVTSPGDKGGLIGVVNPFILPVITACFWDVDVSGINTSAGGTGLTTTQMQTQSTFTDAGWDFVDTWGIIENVSYPFLLWQVK